MGLLEQVKPAKRHQVQVRLFLYGASGSGKSGTALRLAHYLSGGTDTEPGNFLVIDTENHSASLYAVATGEVVNPSRFRFEFQHLNLEPNQVTPASYIEALDVAAQLGVKAVVVDSATHEWQNILDRKTIKDAQPGSNSFTNWGPFTKEHVDFVEALKRPPCHLIVTARAKEEFVIERSETGRNTVRKVGLEAIQRNGFSYELDINLLMQQDDAGVTATVVKTRNPDLLGKVITNPGKDLADQLLIWSQSGEVPPLTRDAMIVRLVREGHFADENAVVETVKKLKLGKPEGVDGYEKMYNTLKQAANVI